MASPGRLCASASASASVRSIVCRRCLQISEFASMNASPITQQKRHIGLRVLAKRKAADEAWAAQAERIKSGEEKNLWDVLKERGFVKDTAGTDEQIRELMRVKRISAYCGVDPTAPSLHVGHLLPFMALFWMYMHGYGAISLIGGATARVGDPTDRLQSREAMNNSELSTNVTKVHYQLKRIWSNVEVQAARFGYERKWEWSRDILHNSAWIMKTSFGEVVHRLFKGMRLGPMLSRENVRRRLDSSKGMPLDEFIYPMMQAWDWWHMYSSPKNTMMQIGGSDQYGNIVTGIDAIKYLRDTETAPGNRKPDDLINNPVGFTVPLMTDSSGAKFGKSAGNAVWLDPFMTSSFDLYGYFVRRPDADVEMLLKLYTFLPLDEIKELVTQHILDPPKRVAQHALAFEVVALAHSRQAAKEAKEEHARRRGGLPITLETAASDGQFPEGDGSAHHYKAVDFKMDIELPESLIMGGNIARILYASGLASSASEGSRLTKAQGAYIGGSPGQKSATNKGMRPSELTYTPIKSWFPEDTKNFLIDGKLLILRRGKHFVRVVRMVSDEEWKESGRFYPGEPGSGEVRRLRNELKAHLGGSDVKLNSLDLQELQRELKFRAEVEKSDNGETTELFFPSESRPNKARSSAEIRPEPDPESLSTRERAFQEAAQAMKPSSRT